MDNVIEVSYPGVVKGLEEILSPKQKEKFYELEHLHEKYIMNHEELRVINNFLLGRAYQLYQEFKKNHEEQDSMGIAAYIYEKAYEDGKSYGVVIADNFINEVRKFKKTILPDQKGKYLELESLFEKIYVWENKEYRQRLKEINNHKLNRAYQLYQDFKEEHINRDGISIATYIYDKAYKDGHNYGIYSELKLRVIKDSILDTVIEGTQGINLTTDDINAIGNTIKDIFKLKIKMN